MPGIPREEMAIFPHLRLLWCALLGPVPVSACETTPALAGQPGEFGDDTPRTRPIPPGSASIQIRVGFFLLDLVEIVTVRQEFTLDYLIQAQWKDPRQNIPLMCP